MPEGDVVLKLSAEEADLMRAILKSTQGFKGMTAEVAKGTKASREAAREQTRMGREAKRTWEQTRTPLERYNARLRDLGAMLRSGKINQDTFSRAVRQSKQELREAGQAGKGVFAGGMLQNLAGMAAGWLSISSAINVARQAFQEYRQIQDEAAQKQRQHRMSVGQLSQISETPEDYRRLFRASQQMYATGGAADMSEAAYTVFTLGSAGMLDQRELITELKARGVVPEPGMMTGSATALMDAMGEKQTGTFREVLSKGFAASGFAFATMEKVLAGAAESGLMARQLGYSDEALLAAVAVASRVLDPKGETVKATSHVKNLLKTLVEKGGQFEGMTFLEALDKIGTMGLKGKEKTEWFGRSEGMLAFEALSGNREMFVGAIEKIRRAQAEDLTGQKLRIAGSLSSTVGARLAAETGAGLELSRNYLGTVTNLAQSAQNDIERSLQEEGAGPIRQFLKRRLMRWRRYFAGDEAFLEEFLPFVENPRLQARIRGTLGQGRFEANRDRAELAQTRAAEKLDRAAGRLDRAAGGGPALGGPKEDK